MLVGGALLEMFAQGPQQTLNHHCVYPHLYSLHLLEKEKKD